MSTASTPRARTTGIVTCSWRESTCTTMRPQVGPRGTCRGGGREGLGGNSPLVPGAPSICPPSASPQEEITSPEPCWWTWNRAPWTRSALAPSARSSGLTTSCSVGPRQKAQTEKPPPSSPFQMLGEIFSPIVRDATVTTGPHSPVGEAGRAVSTMMGDPSDAEG